MRYRVTWLPPPPSVLTINFDGSVIAETTGAGFIIREFNDRLIYAIVVNSPTCWIYSSLVWTVVVVLKLKANQVWMEGNSITVINWVNNGVKEPLSHPLLKDIMQMRVALVAFKASYIFCEENQVANWLTTKDRIEDVFGESCSSILH